MTVLVFLVIKIENLYVPQWYAQVQHQHNYPHRFLPDAVYKYGQRCNEEPTSRLTSRLRIDWLK